MDALLYLVKNSFKKFKRLLRFRSETNYIIHQSKELIRRDKIEELKELAGEVEINVNLEKFRRRPNQKT